MTGVGVAPGSAGTASRVSFMGKFSPNKFLRKCNLFAAPEGPSTILNQPARSLFNED
jgi:hypothetical protein